MGCVGCGCSAVAFVLAFVTAFPLLGWGNWFATIPAALLAILFSLVALAQGEQRSLAVLGLIAGVAILFWALFRLSVGGGLL